MARFPGTETQKNLDGWTPGATIRCRRSRANDARGLMDRRGFVTEVRPHHVCVLIDDGRGRPKTVWLESAAIVTADELPEPELALLGRVFVLLGGQRLELEEDEWVVFGDGFAAEVIDEVRAVLGDRLLRCAIAPHGVHELATHLALAPPDEASGPRREE